MNHVGMLFKDRHGYRDGFTIVELLIVIVVIAILATITLVAYNGIQNQAKSSSVQSTVSGVVRKLEAARISTTNTTGMYPDTLSSVNGLPASDVELEYAYLPSQNYYCVDGILDNISYHASSLNSSVRPGPCPPLDGLVFWVPFAGSAKEFVTDSQPGGSSALGVLTTGQTGVTEGAYELNGTNQYLNYGYSDGLTIGQPGLTMAAWVRPDAVGETKSVINRNGPYLLWLSADRTMGPGLLQGSWYWSTSNDTVNLNQWSHIALTYDGSTQRLYVNGQPSGVYTTLSGNIDTRTSGIVIGRDTSSGGRFYFDGAIDDARLYGRALTASEVAGLYTAGAE